MVFLREVDETSVESCAELKCTKEQCQFTNSPVWTLLQCAYTTIKDKSKVYAIFHEETVVGMVRLDFSLRNDCYMFTNLIIHKDCQRNHYATEAIKEIIDIFKRDSKFTIIKIHVAKGNHAAILLYEKFGFKKTDDNDKYMFTYVYELY